VLVAVDSKDAVVNCTFPTKASSNGADYKLYANDRTAFTAEGGEYELTAGFTDNSTATARTIIESATPLRSR
jgi:hypothetical protein